MTAITPSYPRSKIPGASLEVLHTGQGGLGQLAVMKPLINIRAGDVDAVQIFAVLAQDPQRDKKRYCFPGLIPTQVGTGIRQQGNFLWGSFFCSFTQKLNGSEDIMSQTYPKGKSYPFSFFSFFCIR